MSEYCLERDGAFVTFDAKGRLTAFGKKGFPNLIRQPRPGVWRLFLCQVEDQEIPILPEDQVPPAIEMHEGELVLSYPSLRCRLGELPISLQVSVCVEDGEVHWGMTIQNDSDIMVSEAWCPLVGGLVDLANTPSEQWLAWPQGSGQRLPDPRSWIRRSHSSYRKADQFEVVAKLHYPYPASMSWCDYFTEDQGFFLACFDERFRNGFLSAMLEEDEMTFGCVKYPLIGKGERWESPLYVTAVHQGDWCWGAKRYRRWADTWLRLPTVPEWLKTWFGWQRTILEHQYGEVLWTYDEMQDLLRHAQSADLDSLHILGWWKGGMDRCYPHYDCDERLGGEEAYRRNLKIVRDAGMRVMPYINGRLLDVTMPYFKENGARLTAKTLIGTEYRETYPFSGRGSLVDGLLRHQVQHGIPCPACGEWWDKLEEIIRQVIDHGTDGILIDQIGGLLDKLCFSEEHGHDRPDEAFPLASNHFLARMRENLKADHPDFAIGSEHFVDMTAQHFDYVHGCGTGFRPTADALPAMTRYTFPEFIFTNRDGGYDETNYRHHIGFAMLNGLRFDMSVFRCRGSMADLPEYAKFLPKVRQLHRNTDYLVLSGKYTHHDDYELETNSLEHAGYVGEDGRLAVVVWNPTGETVTCPRPQCGREAQSVHTFDGEVKLGSEVTLSPEDVAVWVFSPTSLF